VGAIIAGDHPGKLFTTPSALLSIQARTTNVVPPWIRSV